MFDRTLVKPWLGSGVLVGLGVGRGETGEILRVGLGEGFAVVGFGEGFAVVGFGEGFAVVGFGVESGVRVGTGVACDAVGEDSEHAAFSSSHSVDADPRCCHKKIRSGDPFSAAFS